MSIKIMSRVWAQSSRKDGELLVMLALADFANDQGESWPSMPVLAQKARLSERQARKVLDKLERAREIRRVRSNGGRNRRNRYVILLSENPEIKTLIKEQGLNNPVFHDRKTLSPVTGALNRHRTVNKERVKDKPSPDLFSPVIDKTISRLNELSGKHYRPNSKDITKNLRAQLKEGFTETDFLLVVDDRWQRWKNNPEMRQHFNPVTLFRPANFEKYLTEAKDANGRGGKQTGGGFVG